MLHFDAAQSYVLENERVQLRPLLLEDYNYLYPYTLQEPTLWDYSLLQPTGEGGLEKYLQQALGARAAGKEYPFIVFDKSTQQYAGSTRFYDIQPNNKSVQLGFTWYGSRFHRTGLNRHCKFLLLQFAFETLGVERVEFRADFNNKKSITAMKNIGCVEEGILRSHCVRPDGSRRDSIILSILQSEWNNSIKALLAGKCR